MYLKHVGSFISFTILIGLAWLYARADHFAGGGRALAAGDPVIAAAGDIACDPSSSSFNGGNGTSGACRQRYTSDLLVNKGFAAILPLGDIQYYCGGYEAFLRSYDLSWGRVKSITRPAVGNHEYLTSGGTGCTSANEGAAGYFKYFGSAAGNPSQGYYSYNIGAWHLIALNSNCSSAGGCGSSSPQGVWLKSDLTANKNLCTLAYWHIPLFSSGGRASSNTRALWQILDDYDVELVLNGHDHIYERFAPQRADGTLDTARGIRQFIVGTGGANHTSLASIAANSLVRNTNTFGILKLTLHPTSYDWQFVPEAGKTFTDSGSAECFGAGQPGTTNTPSPTPRPLATATNTPPSTQVDTQPTTSYSFTPIADAYVNESSPTTNYGTSTQVRVDGSPLVRSYLRFDVRNLTGRITRATLRVYANSALSAGYTARPVTSNTWSETTINYNNAPTFGTSIGSSGAVSAGTWTNVDITSLITGNGTYNLALTTSSSTALSLASREAVNRPQLVVETQNQTATPNPTFTRTPTRTATHTATSTAQSSPTATQTSTPTAVPTNTPQPTATPTETISSPPPATPTITPTETPVPTATSTLSETPVPTDTPMPPATNTDTAEPPATMTPSSTNIPTAMWTPTITPMDTPGTQTFTFTAVADAYVNEASSTTNYGTDTELLANGSPVARSYLRFNLQNLSGRITRVTLRIYANSTSSEGYDVREVTSTWSESSITYDSAPPFGSVVSGSGPFSTGQWTTVDLTSLITGNGIYDLALTTNSTTISLVSREAEANAPQLVIETAP